MFLNIIKENNIIINIQLTRCKQKECEFGYVFNFNIGDCEELVCRKGYEVDESGTKCIGKKSGIYF